MERRGEAGADGLETLFEGAVVGIVQFADTRGIARTAKVFEQHCIIEIAELGRAKLKLAADVTADPGGADAMARGLALGQVKGIAEGRDQFGPADDRARVGHRKWFVSHRIGLIALQLTNLLRHRESGPNTARGVARTGGAAYPAAETHHVEDHR